MTRQLKPTYLDYLPTRNGQEDQLHNHGFAPISAETRENCGGCAQLSNDFMWLRFNDSVADSRDEYGTVEDAMKYAVENIEAKSDPRTERVLRARDRAVA